MHGRLWLMVTACRELALVYVASSMAAKNSPAALPVFLVLFCFKWFYTLENCRSFLCAGNSFVGLCISSLSCGNRNFHQERFSGMGRALMAALVGLIIAMVVNLLQ